MLKVDLKKELDSYRACRGEFRVVDVPPEQYLMVDGQGDPNTAQEYADALAALYPLAYKLKFASKTNLDRDYVVMPLEAIWWASDMDAFTTARDKSAWHWTVMILVPQWITTDTYDAVFDEGARTHQPSSTRFGWRRCTKAAACRRSTSARMTMRPRSWLRCTIPRAGLQMTGRHHEIYLSDPRRIQPSKLRTILRQPVARGDG